MNIERNASKSIINKIYLVFRINMSVFKNEIITVKGYNRLENKIMYPIYEDTIVELKGEFRSEGNIKSIIYFGLHCFREDDSEIQREDINRTNQI